MPSFENCFAYPGKNNSRAHLFCSSTVCRLELEWNCLACNTDERMCSGDSRVHRVTGTERALSALTEQPQRGYVNKTVHNDQRGHSWHHFQEAEKEGQHAFRGDGALSLPFSLSWLSPRPAVSASALNSVLISAPLQLPAGAGYQFLTRIINYRLATFFYSFCLYNNPNHVSKNDRYIISSHLTISGLPFLMNMNSTFSSPGSHNFQEGILRPSQPGL